jgi:nicotinamide mononucleotide (NMN) deamidase PncC
MSIPLFGELLATPQSLNVIEYLKRKAHKSAYDLLVAMNTLATKKKYLQVATTESLTGGMIMSTLVDIPWGGYLKYGCFGVYDTDAKRVFNGVSVDDVYTHKCAAEMAIGVLKNSNATLSIAVTGNAMPLNEHIDMLGEVFIGIAGYDNSNEIIYITKSINSCIETESDNFKSTCKKWYNTIANENRYNPRSETATVSQEIRNYTVYRALKLCVEFIVKFNPVVPDRIIERKQENKIVNNLKIHIQIPKNKFDYGGNGICQNDIFCDKNGIRNDQNINLYKASGGKDYSYKKRKHKIRTRKHKNRTRKHKNRWRKKNK